MKRWAIPLNTVVKLERGCSNKQRPCYSDVKNPVEKNFLLWLQFQQTRKWILM